MEAVGAASAVIAVVEIAAQLGVVCGKYLKAVNESKKNIQWFQLCISSLQDVLRKVQGAVDSADDPILSVPVKAQIDACGVVLKELLDILESHLDISSTGRSILERLSPRASALRWPLESQHVESSVKKLDGFMTVLSTSLATSQILAIRHVHEDIHLSKLTRAKNAAFNAYDARHARLCLENTRVHLLRDIEEWASDPTAQPIFWLNGMAGTGKSTVARTVSHNFRGRKQLAGSFFFRRGGGEASRVKRFCTTLALQLAEFSTVFSRAVSRAVANHPNIDNETLRDQWNALFMETITSVNPAEIQPSTFLLVIDGLDECDNSNDVLLVLQLLSGLRSLRSPQLRVLITSRVEPPVRLGFREMLQGLHRDLIIHTISTSIVEKDIALFFRTELGEVGKARNITMPWPSEQDLNALVRNAECLFQYAATVCAFIGGDLQTRVSPEERLRYVLDGSPAGPVSQLDAMYSQVLQSSMAGRYLNHEKKRLIALFKRFIGAIVVLADSLSALGLCNLLYCPMYSVHVDTLLDTTLLPCSSLLDVTEDHHHLIRPLHDSFRSFLLDPTRCLEKNVQIHETDTHSILCDSAIDLMSRSLKQNICDLEHPGVTAESITPETVTTYISTELQYACKYWILHLIQCEVPFATRQEQMVYTFMTQHFLHWLEVLSIIGKFFEALPTIVKLQEFFQASSRQDLRDFLEDSRRFILTYTTVLESAPLQIYCSALLFSPSTSVVRNVFKNTIPPWIISQPVVAKRWGACMQVLEGHGDPCIGVAFSANGDFIASLSKRDARVWDARTGEIRAKLDVGEQTAIAMAFSQDGQHIAYGAHDSVLRLWDWRTGIVYTGPYEKNNKVTAVAFSPNGQHLASGWMDGTVRVLNLFIQEPEHNMKLQDIDGCSWTVNVLTFSPCGGLVAFASGKMICIWKYRQGRGLAQPIIITLENEKLAIESLAFSPDGRILASSSRHVHTGFRRWDVSTGESRTDLKDKGMITSNIQTVAWSPNGQLIASRTADHTISFWNPETEELCGGLPKTYRVNAVAFSPNGQVIVAAAGYPDWIIRLWKVAEICAGNAIEHAYSAYSHSALALSPDGQTVALGKQDGILELWHISGILQTRFEGHSERVNGVAFSPDSRTLASYSNDNTVSLWNTHGQNRVASQTHSIPRVSEVAFSPDGQLLALASWDKIVRVWSAGGEARGEFTGHRGPVLAVMFSPTGPMVASGSLDKTVRLWSLNGEKLAVFEVQSMVQQLAFSPDGKFLALTSTRNDESRVWDINKEQCIEKFVSRRSKAPLRFTPSGSELKRGGACFRIKQGTHLSNSIVQSETKSISAFEIDQDLRYITQTGLPLLWLPPDWRPAEDGPYPLFRDGHVVIATIAGDLIFLELDSVISTRRPLSRAECLTNARLITTSSKLSSTWRCNTN